MTATLILSSALRTDSGGKSKMAVEAGRTVRETLMAVGIKPELIALVVVNGEQQSKDYVIRDSDLVKALAIIGGG